MVNRPYGCPMCKSVFRTESGMQWHLTRRHETPKALETMQQQFDAKTKTLGEANDTSKKQLDDARTQLQWLGDKLNISYATNLLQKVDNIKSAAEAERLKNDLQTVLLAIAVASYPQAQGNEQHAEGPSYKKPFGKAEMLNSLEANSPRALAPPAAPIARSPDTIPLNLGPLILKPPKGDWKPLRFVQLDGRSREAMLTPLQWEPPSKLWEKK